LAFAAPGGEQRLFRSPLPSLPSHWSRDGKLLLFSAYSRETSWDVWVLPLDDGEPRVLFATAAEEKSAQLSPDGRWVAYTSNQDGTDEIYVQPFPSGGGRWQVSRGGGRQPQWRADGAEIYYVSPDKKLMASDVTTSESAFRHGSPRALLEGVRGAEVERTYHGAPYAVTADGERFFVASPVEATRPITVMLNWPAMLEPPPAASR
jgi:Tol biopolymer transport system component